LHSTPQRYDPQQVQPHEQIHSHQQALTRANIRKSVLQGADHHR
jgi:hypothetical protein